MMLTNSYMCCMKFPLPTGDDLLRFMDADADAGCQPPVLLLTNAPLTKNADQCSSQECCLRIIAADQF
jgi:hypothetical protein